MAGTFANDMASKELIAKIHKQFLLFNIKKTNSLVKKKIGRRPEPTFFQRHTEGQQENEKILNVINHQWNAKTHQNINLLDWLLSKRQETTNVSEDVEKRKASCTASGNVNS